MNEAHLHLMINHLPVIGLLIATLMLAFALLRRDMQLTHVALWMVFLSALATIPVYVSGEGAEEVVENLPAISEALIEDHEELAELALVLTQLTGLLALVSLLSVKKSDQWFKRGTIGTLIAAAVSFATLGLVANSGGKISHPELRDASSQILDHGTSNKDHDDDDD